jgi:hypothetical protein
MTAETGVLFLLSCSGADSLAGDRLGKFNLTIQVRLRLAVALTCQELSLLS